MPSRRGWQVHPTKDLLGWHADVRRPMPLLATRTRARKTVWHGLVVATEEAPDWEDEEEPEPGAEEEGEGEEKSREEGEGAGAVEECERELDDAFWEERVGRL